MHKPFYWRFYIQIQFCLCIILLNSFETHMHFSKVHRFYNFFFNVSMLAHNFVQLSLLDSTVCLILTPLLNPNHCKSLLWLCSIFSNRPFMSLLAQSSFSSEQDAACLHRRWFTAMRERRRNASYSVCSCGTRCAVQTFSHKCYLLLRATPLMLIIAEWVSAEPPMNISGWRRDGKYVGTAPPPITHLTLSPLRLTFDLITIEAS